MRSKAPRSEHNTTWTLTPRSLPGQMPHADLGALPTFLVYRYTMRLPGVRDLRGNKGEWFIITGEHTVVVPHTYRDKITSRLQSGFVRSGVVGQPTTVRQTLDHLEAEKHRRPSWIRHI